MSFITNETERHHFALLVTFCRFASGQTRELTIGQCQTATLHYWGITQQRWHFMEKTASFEKGWQWVLYTTVVSISIYMYLQNLWSLACLLSLVYASTPFFRSTVFFKPSQRSIPDKLTNLWRVIWMSPLCCCQFYESFFPETWHLKTPAFAGHFKNLPVESKSFFIWIFLLLGHFPWQRTIWSYGKSMMNIIFLLSTSKPSYSSNSFKT